MERHASSDPESAAGRERDTSRPEAGCSAHRAQIFPENDVSGRIHTDRAAVRTGSRSAGRFVVLFLLFGTLVGIALLLLLTALVVWLSQVTGSFIVATLILGGAFALLAAGLYLLSIREAVEQIRARAETVYEVARLARSGYEWISGKVAALIGIYDLLRKG